MPEEISLSILDLIFLLGNKVIISIGLALVHLYKDKIMAANDLTEMFLVFDFTKDPSLLNFQEIFKLALCKYKISKVDLEDMRRKYYKSAINEIKAVSTKMTGCSNNKKIIRNK